jgi:hypothetical protein
MSIVQSHQRSVGEQEAHLQSSLRIVKRRETHLPLLQRTVKFTEIHLMIQLQVDRGQGWVDLAYDTTPGYTDTHAFTAALATWKYRGIYRVSDDQVGLWSAEVSVAVGG